MIDACAVPAPLLTPRDRERQTTVAKGIYALDLLDVVGGTTLRDALTVTGSGATALGGTLDVTGATDLGSTLDVTGATTLSAGATVTRNSTGAGDDALAVSTAGDLRMVILASEYRLDLLLELSCPWLPELLQT